MFEIMNLNNSIESYDSKLRYPSFWDTLYTLRKTQTTNTIVDATITAANPDSPITVKL